MPATEGVGHYWTLAAQRIGPKILWLNGRIGTVTPALQLL
jgi:hypothetical protein